MPQKSLLLQAVRHKALVRRFSPHTGRAYEGWIRRSVRSGHRDVSTTMVSMHVLNRGGSGGAETGGRVVPVWGAER